jgi:DNA repair protein RadC
MNIELTRDQKIKVMNSSMVFKVMKQILMRENEIERDQEHVWIVCLAANNKILNIELISLGAIDETIIKPMQVFRIAILKGAVKLVMIHNHPTGELVPTSTDQDITDRMIQVGNIVNVQVIDHLIISEKHYYSFDDHGLMEELRKSKKWVPGYVEVERLLKEARKIAEKKGKKEGKKEGERNKAINIAKKSLKEGLSIEVISKITGLSKEDIEKL